MAFSGALVSDSSNTTYAPGLTPSQIDTNGPQRLHHPFTSMHQAGRATQCPRERERSRSSFCTYYSPSILLPVHRRRTSRRKSESTHPDLTSRCRPHPPCRTQRRPNHRAENYNRHKSVSTIALRAGMSRSSACHAFRAPNHDSHVPTVAASRRPNRC
jgi:hypothetical protein